LQFSINSASSRFILVSYSLPWQAFKYQTARQNDKTFTSESIAAYQGNEIANTHIITLRFNRDMRALTLPEMLVESQGTETATVTEFLSFPKV